ncbi:MAG: signal peptidase II [Betaproteobacteria bacterium]
MATSSNAAGIPSWGRWLWVSAGVIAADQLTKALVLATIREGDGMAVTPFLTLVLTFNTGAAFSFLASAGGWQRWFFVAIAVIAAIVIVALLKRGGTTIYRIGLVLILGGALGNLYDRLMLGKVVDFLLFHYAGWAYPAFNVADSAITVGAVLVVLDTFRHRSDDAARVPKGIR